MTPEIRTQLEQLIENWQGQAKCHRIMSGQYVSELNRAKNSAFAQVLTECADALLATLQPSPVSRKDEEVRVLREALQEIASGRAELRMPAPEYAKAILDLQHRPAASTQPSPVSDQKETA